MCGDGGAGWDGGLQDGAGGNRQGAAVQHLSDSDSYITWGLQTAGVCAKD